MATIDATDQKMGVGQLLGEAEARFTEIVDHGVSMEEAVSGRPLPATGIRFDLVFEGTGTGLIEGTVSGVGLAVGCAAWARKTEPRAALLPRCGGSPRLGGPLLRSRWDPLGPSSGLG